MNATQLKEKLAAGALGHYAHLYADLDAQSRRYADAIDAFTALYGDDRELYLFSVPGRSELSGNHTDHQHGRVLAGAIDRDIIAVVSPSKEPVIHLKSEGYDEDLIKLADCADKSNFKQYSSSALIAGTCAAFTERGVKIGGFDAYTTTEVLKGSGISSSAAFEVMIGNILNHLANGGRFANEELAKIAQYAENEYFGKPCGLMDQMACAVGGFVYIDFEDPKNPLIEPIDFSLTNAGYALCIVNTGGNHADLNADYASVPAEMKSVAAYFGRDVLRPITEEQIIANAPILRRVTSDRALLRALHFVRENARVAKQAEALRTHDVDTFLSHVLASGNSSFRFLQNVYTTVNPAEQGLSLALAVTEGALDGKGCAWRVHGGGFAGTIQAFVRREYVDEYCALMDSVFGEGATMTLQIRPEGAVKIEI
ncbi:MAG: galactokinase [Clostridia bacterium]|nr:galactokinase [Clostridia bacterium]